MITCAKHFHKNLVLFYPVWQDKIHVELGQAGIFRRFHWRKNFYDETKWHHNFSHFSKARKAPRVARHPSRFGIHLKSDFRATAFKGIFTTCGDYPLTTPPTLPSFLPSLILIKSSLIHKFFCALHFGTIYTFIWSEERLFEKREIQKYQCQRAKVQNPCSSSTHSSFWPFLDFLTP